MNEIPLKLIVIGDVCTGKSSIMSSYVNKIYNNEYTITIGVDYFIKRIIHNDVNYKIQIWDTAGAETYHSIVKSYYRNVHGCIIVYDITRMRSFTNVKKWLYEFRESFANENTPILLIGNKKDKINRRQVSYDDGLFFAKTNGLLFYETTINDNETIENCFKLIIDKIHNDNTYLQSSKKNTSLNIESDDKKSKCC